MTPARHLLLSAAAIGLVLAAPLGAQEAPVTAEPPAPAAGTAPEAPASAAPQAPAPATGADAVGDAPAGTAPADAAAPAPGAAEAPAQPEITVTEHGDWEVGCLAGTSNCEMQQVALDASQNPVILVRLVKLPADAEAESLAIFNTPLGTLLPNGLGFRIDQGEAATLPFEWCVQEGCVVRLGLREAEVAAMKRGRAVTLTVTSIADADQPVELTLSLTGFTAAYDSLAVPEVPAEPAAPAQE